MRKIENEWTGGGDAGRLLSTEKPIDLGKDRYGRRLNYACF